MTFWCSTGNTGTLNRDISIKECFWLPGDLPKGMIVFRFTGCDYGVTRLDEVSVCLEPNEYPAYAIPETAVNWD